MKTNVVMFPLFIETEEQKSYYGMLYYALQTLTQQYNEEFDIVVYYYSSTYNILDHKNFLTSEKNIFVDFPQVKFVRFQYKQLEKIDGYFFKWNAVDHLYSMGYEKALIIDVDVIFYQNPADFFDKYDNYHAHILRESSDPTVIKVLGRPGIAGGQLLLTRELYETKIHNIYEKILFHRRALLNKAKEVLDSTSYFWFKTLCDQYALYETLTECEVPLSVLSDNDISFGDACYTVKVRDNEPLVLPKTNIVHYLGSRAYRVLPSVLLPASLLPHQKNYLSKLEEATEVEFIKWSLV